MKRAEAIEARTQRIGRELFARIDTSGPSVFKRQWWDDWVMDWSMADETVKVQMFRFIDALPMLEDPAAVAEHLQAYFNEGAGHFPLLVRLGAGLAEPGTFRGDIVARAIRQNATRLARRFIAGANPDEVLETVLELRSAGMTFTMDLLGEATVTEREAEEYLAQYVSLIERLGPEAARWVEIPQLDRDPFGPIPRVNLSVKISALYSQFDPVDPEGTGRVVKGRLREVFRAAARHGAFLNIDMEQYACKDLTIAIFTELLAEPEFRDWPDAGIALQAYLPETPGDLERLLDWVRRRGTPVWVRLVKGAYWDYETVIAAQRHWPTPVWAQKWQTDACFEECTTFLLENHEQLRPALASHNLRSMAHALAVAELLDLPKSSYELQMLYGMGDELKRVFVERGQRLRVYTPFGKLLPGMAYLVRRLLENTSNTSFLRATFSEHTPIEQLLLAPTAVGSQHEEEAMPRHNPASENLPPFANEPLLDFGRAIHREQMQHALAEVRHQFGQEYELWIDGRPLQTGSWIESTNPADFATVVGRVARGGEADADRAVAAALRAFPDWRDTSVFRRAGVLFETAARMRQRRLELAAWQVYECGKQWREADADVAEAIDYCEYYARSMLELSGPRERNVPGETNSYGYTPRGVCVTIAPWNFPLAILCGMTMAPVVAGNTVVVKPSEQSSVVAAKFFEILRELDLPPGVVNFVPGPGSAVGRKLVRHPQVAVITFTGSVEVGLEINRAAAETSTVHVKHVIAEMGGKNAIIVDDDADLDEAIKGVLASAFGYQGQKCSACSRVIVLDKVYDLFVNRLVEATKSLSIGPPEDPAHTIGPVIDRLAFERLTQAIETGKSAANCLYAGETGRLAEKGYYIGPHIFADAAADSMLAQTELFGPVLVVFRAAHLEQALALANSTRFALTGGVYSRNPRSIARVRQELLVGNLYINRKITGAEVDRQPFGGMKLSGVGAKAGGPDYLRHFLVPRTITENTLRRGFAPQEK